jgi:hypothetical protein
VSRWTVKDVAGDSGSITGDVTSLRLVLPTWYPPHAPGVVYEGVTELCDMLERGDDVASLALFLGLHVAAVPEPKPIGRPSTGTLISTRLPEDMIDMLDGIADQDGVTRAEVLRRIVAAEAERRSG